LFTILNLQVDKVLSLIKREIAKNL